MSYTEMRVFWYRTADRLPTTNIKVLVVLGNEHRDVKPARLSASNRWVEPHWKDPSPYEDEIEKVTHWAHMPLPPEETK